MIRNIIYITIALLLMSFYAFAQDKIITLENDSLNVDIVELSLDEVHYRLWNDSNEIYKIKQENIVKILLAEKRNKKSPIYGNSLPIIYKPEKRNIYLVEDIKSVSSFWDLEEFIIRNPEARIHFLKARSAKSQALGLGLAAVGTFISGLVIRDLYKDHHEHSYVRGSRDISRIFMFRITPIMGTFAILYQGKSSRSKNNAFDAYGIKTLAAMNYFKNSDIVECKFGITQNGVGLVLNF